MLKKKWILIGFIIISLLCYIFYLYTKPPYIISNKNVEAIYCTYSDYNGYHTIQVSDSDKEIILSEVSKMRESNVNDEIGTVNYNFTIELINGDKFTFHENTSKIISLYSSQSNFFRNIRAPKTADFIKRFTDDNNIERY